MRLPQNACDCQIHVFDDPARYPVRHENPHYAPPAATIDDARALHRQLGFERAVIVQASIYRTDHSLLRDVLRAAPAGTCRGVAIVDDGVTDQELERLHEAGVRGGRFNFFRRLGLVPSLETFRRSLDRIRALGWCAKIFATPEELLPLEPELRRIKQVAVIDHMGRLDYRQGLEQPAVRLILDLLKRENWWIMLSNGDRSSTQPDPWRDAVPFGRAFHEAAPDRSIWGSDWPHVGLAREQKPDDARLLELLRSYLPDEAALRSVLADNPARLFGFGR